MDRFDCGKTRPLPNTLIPSNPFAGGEVPDHYPDILDLKISVRILDPMIEKIKRLVR